MSETIERAETTSARTRTGTRLGIAALVVAGITVALWFRQIDQVAIPENRAIFIAFFLAAAALGVSAFVARTRGFGGVAAALAVLIGAFFPFSIAISRQEVGVNGIQVGDTIPHFRALDESGEFFDSSLLAGQRVLMKFFRGHW